MLAKNNARPLAKVPRAKAEISAFILAHPTIHLATLIGVGLVGCLCLWAFMWLMWFAFGAV